MINIKEKLGNFRDFLISGNYSKIFALIGFTVIMTGILASQNYFFQNIIENGISKRDIIAQKTLTVIDVKRTEQHRKEVASRVEPILAAAEDEFIKNNLTTLENSIIQIRKKDTDIKIKEEELGILLDISDSYKRAFIISFLLKSDESSLHEAFDKANMTLNKILRVGITENDFQRNKITQIITNNMNFT